MILKEDYGDGWVEVESEDHMKKGAVPKSFLDMSAPIPPSPEPPGPAPVAEVFSAFAVSDPFSSTFGPGSLNVSLPAQEPSGASDESPTQQHQTVADWLAQNKLSDFVVAAEENGVQDLQDLLDMSADEIDELMVEMKLKIGHKKTFKRALETLRVS